MRPLSRLIRKSFHDWIHVPVVPCVLYAWLLIVREAATTRRIQTVDLNWRSFWIAPWFHKEPRRSNLHPQHWVIKKNTDRRLSLDYKSHLKSSSTYSKSRTNLYSITNSTTGVVLGGFHLNGHMLIDFIWKALLFIWGPHLNVHTKVLKLRTTS